MKNVVEKLKNVLFEILQKFSICQNENLALKKLVELVEQLPIDANRFDVEDQTKLRVFSLREDLEKKSNRSELVQLKFYFENQIKKLIEINKSNAKDLDRMKTCQTNEIRRQNNFRQSSKPFLTFELNEIRKYQRQALLRTSDGTIPLYRRQFWVKTNRRESKNLILNFCSDR